MMTIQMRKYFKTVGLWAGLLGVMSLFLGAVDRGTGRVPDRGAGGAMTWMTLDQAAVRLQQEKRPVLIDLYTTWCGWCRQMDRKTYSNKRVEAYLEEKYYCVRVDAGA